MQKCKICGADIRYIATTSMQSVTCDYAKQKFVTENGRVCFGYLIHECKKSEKQNENDNREEC